LIHSKRVQIQVLLEVDLTTPDPDSDDSGS